MPRVDCNPVNYNNIVVIMCLPIPAARDAFKAFDKRNEDQIKVGDIAGAMKKMGHNIKADWLEKMEDMIDTEGETQL